MEESGSSKRKRRVSRKTADQEPEDRNGPTPNKDKAFRDNKSDCWIKVEDLICDVINGDNSIRSTVPWKERKKIVEMAHKQLKDPLFLLQRLEKMEPSITRDTDLKNAFQMIESFLKRLKNPVTDHQEYSDGIFQEIPHFQLLSKSVKTLQDCRKDLQSYKNQLMQKNAVCDSKKQSAEMAKAFGNVSAMLSKVTQSCYEKINDDIENPSNPSRGNFVQNEGEQLVFYFPTSPHYTKSNLHGKNDENSNSRMIDQEEPEKEVNFTVATVGERVVKVALKMPNNDLDVILQTMPNAQVSNHTTTESDLENLPGSARQADCGEGTSNSIANDVNTIMSHDLDSRFRSYRINPCYAEVLAEIVQNHPDFDKEFLVRAAYVRNFFMNTLAGIFYDIKNNGESFNFYGIINVKSTVRDMEHNGMELSWIKEKLEPARRMVITNLQEVRDHHRNELEETERQLAMLEETEDNLNDLL